MPIPGGWGTWGVRGEVEEHEKEDGDSEGSLAVEDVGHLENW